MATFLSRLRNPLRRFLGDEAGTVVAEGVIALPVLLWAYIGLFVYWDAFRSLNTLQKAAYTVSDMMSREMLGVGSAYVDGMDKVVEYLIDADADVRMRVTSVTWSDIDQQFQVHWSRSPDNELTPLTTETLQDYAGQIPTMAPGDYVVIVETDMDYVPAFDVGMDDKVFRQFIVTRPRFIPCIPMDAISCPVS